MLISSFAVHLIWFCFQLGTQFEEKSKQLFELQDEMELTKEQLNDSEHQLKNLADEYDAKVCQILSGFSMILK